MSRARPIAPPLQDALTKLRQRQILRSLANRAPFTKAAIEVVRRWTGGRRQGRTSGGGGGGGGGAR